MLERAIEGDRDIPVVGQIIAAERDQPGGLRILHLSVEIEIIDRGTFQCAAENPQAPQGTIELVVDAELMRFGILKGVR